jgi:hypothetical protein
LRISLIPILVSSNISRNHSASLVLFHPPNRAAPAAEVSSSSRGKVCVSDANCRLPPPPRCDVTRPHGPPHFTRLYVLRKYGRISRATKPDNIARVTFRDLLYNPQSGSDTWQRTVVLHRTILTVLTALGMHSSRKYS